MTIKFKVGDVVKVKSGKTYRIVSLLDDRYEDDYNAVQMRDGKQYGPHRHFKHTSFVGLPLYNTEDRKEVTTIEPIVTVIITYPNDPRPAKHCLPKRRRARWPMPCGRTTAASKYKCSIPVRRVDPCPDRSRDTKMPPGRNSPASTT
jgi:uncharacterized protein YodC (DUF2158 family)